MNFRIGIIGYGKMGKIRDRTIQKLGIGKVVSIYDPNETVSPKDGFDRYSFYLYSKSHDQRIYNQSTKKRYTRLR